MWAIVLVMAVLAAGCEPPPGMSWEPVINTSEPAHEDVVTPSPDVAAAEGDMASAAGFCCYPSYALMRTPDWDPGHSVRKSWWAAVSVESSYPTAVAATKIDGNTAAWQARAVHGVDSLGDYHDRNYILGALSPYSVWAYAGANANSYGMTVVMWDGNTFEGCDAHSNPFGYGPAFICDYYSHKMSTPWPQNRQGADYILRKTWGFWFSQVGDELGCAAAISNVLALAYSWLDGWLADCWIYPK